MVHLESQEQPSAQSCFPHYSRVLKSISPSVESYMAINHVGTGEPVSYGG